MGYDYKVFEKLSKEWAEHLLQFMKVEEEKEGDDEDEVIMDA